MSYSQKLLAYATAVRSVLPDPERPGRVKSAVDALEGAERLDPVLHTVRRGVRALPLGDDVRDALHGRWLGHPVHPALVQVPLGTWLSAAVLDLLPGRRPTAGLLVGTGLAAAVPT
ncbi:MAG: (2Fe-2S)-binding protein, partial [Streptomyces sp.]